MTDSDSDGLDHLDDLDDDGEIKTTFVLRMLDLCEIWKSVTDIAEIDDGEDDN